MTRIIIVALVVLFVSGGASAKTYNDYLHTPCNHFTELYARSGFKMKDGKFPQWKDEQFGLRLSYIYGYLTYAGRNVLPEGHHVNNPQSSGLNLIAWIGSWCRDHPSKDITHAIDAFIEK